MQTQAIVMNEPGNLALRALALTPVGPDDVVVDVAHSAISAGTERLLFSGSMPSFPGMGYPLVPGYEAVGTIRQSGAGDHLRPGDFVFVPGATCYGEVRGLFGGAASTLVVAKGRVKKIARSLGADATLLALASTAYHAIIARGGRLPELIVGHGVLGQLLARITLALGGDTPCVWELNEARRGSFKGAFGDYSVIHPEEDERTDYSSIYEAAGDAALMDVLIARLAPFGEIVLAGFYGAPISFSFPPAFMREARVRVAAEWKPEDLEGVLSLMAQGRLSLAGLVTHRQAAGAACEAYDMAFNDPSCLKMVLDWDG